MTGQIRMEARVLSREAKRSEKKMGSGGAGKSERASELERVREI